MKKQDLHKSSIPAQETICVKLLEALDNGTRMKDVNNHIGVSETTIYKWLKVRRTRKKNWQQQESRGRPRKTIIDKSLPKSNKKRPSK
ncbi:MAG: hypothetical protein WCJ74_01835 [bacterium]